MPTLPKFSDSLPEPHFFIWPYIYQMEVLENLEVERQQIDRVNELLELKDSLQQQLTKSTIKQVIMNFLS